MKAKAIPRRLVALDLILEHLRIGPMIKKSELSYRFQKFCEDQHWRFTSEKIMLGGKVNPKEDGDAAE